MILIADSGSTKTDWVVAAEGRLVGRCTTQGINPFHQSESQISDVLRQELLPQVLSIAAGHSVGGSVASHADEAGGSIRQVLFYGSGVTSELEPLMERQLQAVFPQAVIEARSDLYGAARAVCGSRRGIACILGTGANSCLWDGRHIVQNTPALGYILGDEGSGAVLGIRFLNALYKGALPQALRRDFERHTGLTMADVIRRVYREPMANRFLASLSPFIKQHADMPDVRQMVVDNFRCFFRRNVAPYFCYGNDGAPVLKPAGSADMPVGFVGSIASYYGDELREAAAAEGFTVGTVLRSPIEGLVKQLFSAYS